MIEASRLSVCLSIYLSAFTNGSMDTITDLKSTPYLPACCQEAPENSEVDKGVLWTDHIRHDPLSLRVSDSLRIICNGSSTPVHDHVHVDN